LREIIAFINFKLTQPIKYKNSCWVWWYTPVIPALGRIRQENHEFEGSLVYTVRPCLKKTTKRTLF
jgi:hypothetical protein